MVGTSNQSVPEMAIDQGYYLVMINQKLWKQWKIIILHGKTYHFSWEIIGFTVVSGMTVKSSLEPSYRSLNFLGLRDSLFFVTGVSRPGVLDAKKPHSFKCFTVGLHDYPKSISIVLGMFGEVVSSIMCGLRSCC